jgi:two-component system chemotaxis sensor kinase CheA
VDPLLASLLQDFIDECLPLAQQVGATVLEMESAWEAERDTGDELRQVQGALHTIKGGAGMMSFTPIEALAHALEDVSSFVGAHPERRGRQEIELLLEGADLLIALVRRSQDGPVDAAATQAFQRHVAEVLGLREGGAGRPEPGPAVRERAPEPALPRAIAAAPSDDGTSVRIDDRKVDELMELAGETVVTHTELQRIHALASKGRLGAKDLAAFDALVGALGRTTHRLRDELLRIRLMPVSSLFVRFRRYLRDLARERGQPIQLTIEGAETTLDRAVLSRLHEPMLHMIRNAVAHGLEPPEARAAAGKPAEASIVLAAKLVSGRVKIAVVDDGRGIDVAAVARKAQAQGISTEGLGEDELRRLIFLPNFSTAQAVSNLAGRGVGLDVVAEVVHGLGGSVDVESVPGAGTAFLLNLPITVSQMKALLVAVDGEPFVVPLGFVLESVPVDQASLHEVGPTRVLPWRGELIPVVDAGALLGTRAREGGRGYCVILSSGSRRRGLLVDRLQKRQEVIIKPLDEALGPVRVVFGLCLLGDGRVAPILDCAHILGQGAGARAAPAGGYRGQRTTAAPAPG